jgi:hypothetical protein
MVPNPSEILVPTPTNRTFLACWHYQCSIALKRSEREREDRKQLRHLFYNKSFTALPFGAVVVSGFRSHHGLMLASQRSKPINAR